MKVYRLESITLGDNFLADFGLGNILVMWVPHCRRCMGSIAYKKAMDIFRGGVNPIPYLLGAFFRSDLNLVFPSKNCEDLWRAQISHSKQPTDQLFLIRLQSRRRDSRNSCKKLNMQRRQYFTHIFEDS